MTLEKLREIAFEHELNLSFGRNEAHKGDKIIRVKTGKWKTDLDVENLKEIFDPVEVKILTTKETVQFELVINEGEVDE